MAHCDPPVTGLARAILEALEESSPATAADLATLLETHPVTLERRCRDLQREGYVRRCRGGTYALDDDWDADRRPTTLADDTNTTTNPAD